MNVSFIFLIATVAFFEAVAAATDDGVLSGYLVKSDDSKCLGIDGTSVGTPASASTSDLYSACIQLYLVEGSAAQMYKILKLNDKTQKLKLEASSAPAFVTDGTETEVQFSDHTNLIDATTAGSVTTKAASFLIQLSGATASSDDCLTDAPSYLLTTCGVIKWYFIETGCLVADCVTCEVDALRCDTCVDERTVLNAETGFCQGCDVALDGFCNKCSDTTGTALCTECGGSKILHSDGTSCIDACTVENCKFCDTDPATCDTCDDGLVEAGNTCVEATTNAPTTEASSTDADSDATTTADGSTLATIPILSVVLFVLGMKSLTCV